MKNFMIRANNELAHLTIERKSGKLKEKEWDVSDIFLEFCKCVKLFFNNLPDQYRNIQSDSIFQSYKI
jgi:hypothetical protein